MKKKIVIVTLLTILIFIVLLGICVGVRVISSGVIKTEYWPSNMEDADNYLWIDEKHGAYLISYEPCGMLGLLQNNGAEVPIFFEYGRFDGKFFEYSADLFIIFDGNITTSEGIGYPDFPKEKVYTKAPKFTEDGFSTRITDNQSDVLFSDVKKLVFTKRKKTEVTPYDLGFDAENWDSILENVKFYYYVSWGDGKWGDFYFDDYDGTSSEKCVKFRELLDEGKEEEAMKLVDAFGLQGQ